MKNENWDRFLPKFKKENKPAKKKTVVKEKKWSRRRRVTRRYTPFPPENHITPSKVAEGGACGDQEEVGSLGCIERRMEAKIKSQKKKEEREKLFVPPKEKM